MENVLAVIEPALTELRFKPMSEPWYTQRLRCKPDKAVVRLFGDDGTFLGVVNTPTVLWPLNASYEVFNANNCELIDDPAVVEIVDAIPYRIGHCYQNAENVTRALQAAGYDATQYVGWLFVGEQYPIHHSWTVLNSSQSWTVLNGNHVIDLADEFAVLHANHEQFDENASMDKARELMVEFHKWIRQFPNSKRIMTFGVPAGNLLYIGCPCSREEGIEIYNQLTRNNPNHPCNERLVKGQNRTKMQMMLQEAGLMAD